MKNITREQAHRTDPVRDLVIIQVERPAEKSGNFLVPETARKRDAYGRVLKIGPGARRGRKGRPKLLYPLTVQPGDIVLLPKWYDADQAEERGEKFLIGQEAELLAIVGHRTRVAIL